MKSRREFLKQSAIASGLVTLFNACGPAVKSSVSSLDPDAINLFRKNFSGSIIIPGDAGYDAARKVRTHNPGTDKFPSIVAQCAGDDDVLRCIELAHKYSLEVAVRSGNHSSPGWSTTEKGIVIDLSKMKSIDVDPSGQKALIKTGSNAQEILAATYPHGLAPVLGQCGTVGAGLLLGGGLGWLSGTHGATCDNLLSVQLITPEGKSLRVDSENNSDLFWAVRGGGGNFGILTSVEYMLHPVTEVIAGRFVYPLGVASEMFTFFSELMAEAPDELQADCYILPEGDGIFIMEFVYSGDLNKGDQLMDQVRKHKRPFKDEMKRRPFSEVYNMYGESPEGGSGYKSMKGFYVEKLSSEVFGVVLERFKAVPPKCFTFFNFSHYMHGAVCKVPPEATAFELRKSGAAHLVTFIAWQDESSSNVCMDWHEKTSAALKPFTGGRIYANYLSEYKSTDAPAMYGTNYGRLVELKKKYDPHNFFHLNQNIDPNYQISQ
jgi:FAD/FMN-containing dehydrogenase